MKRLYKVSSNFRNRTTKRAEVLQASFEQARPGCPFHNLRRFTVYPTLVTQSKPGELSSSEIREHRSTYGSIQTKTVSRQRSSRGAEAESLGYHCLRPFQLRAMQALAGDEHDLSTMPHSGTGCMWHCRSRMLSIGIMQRVQASHVKGIGRGKCPYSVENIQTYPFVAEALENGSFFARMVL